MYHTPLELLSHLPELSNPALQHPVSVETEKENESQGSTVKGTHPRVAERQHLGIKLETVGRGCCIGSQTHTETQTEWWLRDSVGVHTPPFPKITTRWGAGRQGEVGTGRYKWMLIVWLLQITLKSSRFIHKPTLCLCMSVCVCQCVYKWSCSMAYTLQSWCIQQLYLHSCTVESNQKRELPCIISIIPPKIDFKRGQSQQPLSGAAPSIHQYMKS